MNVLWDGGALSMRDIVDRLPEPQPHFNTVATFVRRLENSGMVTQGPVFIDFVVEPFEMVYPWVLAGDPISKVL